ncbi:MAG: glycosyltransferase [Ilumatobacteraceae bacterium]|nr:glycosyltransferase [Ilumatobacteraceae bacterium]
MAADLARRATIVVAGNHLIADWAVSSGARDVRIIPTCYEPLVTSAQRSSPLVEIVWIGSPSTAAYLEVERDRLKPLRHLPNTRVTFVGGRAPTSLRGLPNVRELSWTAAIEHDVLSTADYGLAIQPRTPYADHKCGFKIVQYMAYGVVPVATPNPVHESIIGPTGLLLGPAVRENLAEQLSQKPTAEQRAAVADRWESAFSTSSGTQKWARLLRSIS